MISRWIANYRKKRSERRIKRLNALWSGWLDDISGVNEAFKNVHSDNSNKEDSRPS